MTLKLLEVETRKWEEFEDSVAEDSAQGKWDYAPVQEMLKTLAGCEYVSVEESEEGIKLKDLVFGDVLDKNPFYFLSGRRPDRHDDANLCKPEVIRKGIFTINDCGDEEEFSETGYANYCRMGLMTPDHRPLEEMDLLRVAGIFTALKFAAEVYLKNEN